MATTDPIVYLTKEDLENALSPTTVVALFADDPRAGVASDKALKGVLRRASRWVDSFLARSFVGPFPVAQAPVPEIIKNAALEFAIAFSFERHPEYVHEYGEEYRSGTRFKRACELMERICSSGQEIPDWTLEPRGRNVGGIVIDDGFRTIVTGADGQWNQGDF